MMFEDAQFMAAMYNISPELTCQCDEVHTCQQCYEEWQEETAYINAPFSLPKGE